MIEQLIFVLAGIATGTVAGLLPGIGVLTSLILVYPFLQDATVIQLILFYMSLAAMVQFSGTIPSVFMGMPGETNSAPTVIEGTKFTRHNASNLAVGISALGSVLGSIIAVVIFVLISDFALESFSITVSNRFKAMLYLFIFAVVLCVYNNKNFLLNTILVVFGFTLSTVGESPVNGDLRLTFGISDLTQGLSIVPVITGILVVPAVLNNIRYTSQDIKNQFTIVAPVVMFCKNISSSIRGSIVGFFAGLVPGVSTVLSTNLSYSLENTLHKNRPGKKLIASETANNSGQFASMIPLLLFGIPITGSEIFLYNMLIESGWDSNQFSRISENVGVIIYNVLPWFVLVNIAGFLISWPFAQQAMIIFKLPQRYLTVLIFSLLVAVNFYVGYTEFRLISYCTQFVFFAIIGFLLKRVNMVPVLFSFLLGNELEGVLYREYLFLLN